jgi:hypothetical protein
MMTIDNKKTSDEGVSRKQLDKWQRADAKKQKDKPTPDPADDKSGPPPKK